MKWAHGVVMLNPIVGPGWDLLGLRKWYWASLIDGKSCG